MRNGNKQSAGFTLVEVMIVMAMVATLMAIVLPRYYDGLQRSRETALTQNLKEMRQAIEHYYEDNGSYPVSLEVLVTEKYLRFVPVDPETQRSDSWQTDLSVEEPHGIVDVHSGSEALARNGTPYASW